MSFDVIGDIHGQADKLEALLVALGYTERNSAWRHPSRTAIFVGDLIDRGPGQLRTLRLVRTMHEAGSAQVAMGNHELNAIAWATPDAQADGHHLRPRHGDKGAKNLSQHRAFLAEVGADSAEHAAWIAWFMEMPLWIERDDLRVVHACWDPDSVAVLRPLLRDGARLDLSAVEASCRRGSAVHGALEVVLKGAEVALPDGVTFRDKEGVERDAIRIHWWNPALTTYRDAYIGPDGVDMPDIPMPSRFNIPEPDRPTIIGHYWFDPRQPPAPAARRVACVDYSAGKGGPLVAYRFDGEPEFSAEKFVAVQ